MVEQIVRWRPEPNLLTEEHLEHGEANIRMIGRMNYGVSEARRAERLDPRATIRRRRGSPVRNH